jgi:hypothetical protein
MKHTEMIIVIGAHSGGKLIQVRRNHTSGPWVDAMGPVWDFSKCEYRVKPAPKYKTTTVDTGRELFEYVEAKALEHAVNLININNLTPSGLDKLAALKKLLN